MRFLASAKDVKGGIAGVVGKEAGLFDDLLGQLPSSQRLRQPAPRRGARVARGRLPGHGGGDAAAARVVVRARRGAPGDGQALLLLPAGGGRDRHLPLRGAGPTEDARDRRPPALRTQARHRHRQDRGDGALRHLGDAAQAQGERLVALGELPGAGAEPHGARPGERRSRAATGSTRQASTTSTTASRWCRRSTARSFSRTCWCATGRASRSRRSATTGSAREVPLEEGRFIPQSVLRAMRRRARQDPNAPIRRLLGGWRDLVVINDEAHHVYGEKRTRKGEDPELHQVEQDPRAHLRRPRG